MKKHLIILLLIALGLQNSACSTENAIDYVDPNIGTVHSRWFFYTPGAVPFGMAKLGPSTNGTYGNENGWEAVGYDNRHNSIEGFACFHEFQVGGVMLQPVVGELKTSPGLLDSPGEGYRSGFDKKDEYATAGYYSVILKDYDVKAELTATKRVGFQRFTFPASQESRIIFDVGNQLGESGEVQDSYIKIIDENTLEGYVITKPEYVKKYQPEAEVKIYFFATLDKQADSFNTFFRNGDVLSDSIIQGKGACAALNFSTRENEAVNVKIGLSYTSIENAKENFFSEADSKEFDVAKSEALNIWNDYLGRIKVEGGKKEDKVKF
jgi:putative alpha-1,2-mannosidase